MDAKRLAGTLGWGRLAFGVAMMAAPERVGRSWVGADGAKPGPSVVMRSFGAREVLLGFLGAHVVSRPGVGRRTVAALALMDLVDLAGTLAARRSLPAAGVAAVAGVAGPAAVAGLLAARGLPDA
jgi:hypothetical protein